ncbi:MAG: DUF4163 domain-containing protein [Lachnospiraceae bacterium]|nr:DUF4163 domain-containing protein [Lachnospiraceae bacterium]
MRTRILYASLVLVMLLVVIWGASCTGKAINTPQNSQNTEGDTRTEEALLDDRENAEDENTSDNDQLFGGSTGEMIYEMQYIEKQYEAEDGTAIFEMTLAYPLFNGDDPAIERINSYFYAWAQKRMDEYEKDENSIRQSALEVYRESRDFGWQGPWSESTQVTSVKAAGGYLSVLMDSYLNEGNAHGVPYREDHLFRLSDGKKINLSELIRFENTDFDEKLRARFNNRIGKGEENEFYDDAFELLQKINMADVGCYFSETGIVFYLPPYEIAPYSTGYVEVEMPYEEVMFE